MDLISRQAAIDAIEHYLKNPPKNHSQLFIQGIEDGYYRVLSILRQLPSAQMDERTRLKHMIADAPTIEPERKKGEWSEAERKKSEVFYCSLCGGKAYYPRVGSRKDERKNECRYVFCPNCGADMRGDEE